MNKNEIFGIAFYVYTPGGSLANTYENYLSLEACISVNVVKVCDHTVSPQSFQMANTNEFQSIVESCIC